MERTITPQFISQSLSVDGETAEFEALFHLHRPKVFRFALASLRDRDAAETITQDCFFKAFKARESFRNECSLDTWLMQITVNLIRDYARNRRLQFWKRTQERSAPVESMADWLAQAGHTPEGQAALKEKVAAVWAAAEQLPERQRTVFLLRFVEDMDLLEIAAATGLKEGTVKAHLFRALESVRARMGKQA